MPRTKRSPRGIRWRGKKPDNALPESESLAALVGMVHLMPTKASGDSDAQVTEPAAKRTKTTASRHVICVARERLQLPSREANTSSESTVITKRNVGEALGLKLTKVVPLTPESDWNLIFFPRERSPKDNPFWVTYAIKYSDLSNKQLVALNVAQTQGFDYGDPGCVWASIDICIRQKSSSIELDLSIEVRWNESISVWGNCDSSTQQSLRDSVLGAWYPELRQNHLASLVSWSPQDFYEAAFVPDKDVFNAEVSSMEAPQLQAQLYPFQRRAVQWLLRREGVQWHQDPKNSRGNVQPYQPLDRGLPVSFVPVEDVYGEDFYASPIFGSAIRDTSVFLSHQNIRGGILAEEMGLGKTLEVIALVLLHQRPEASAMVFDPYTSRELLPTSATLIVTPSTLLDQWISELNRHAPTLRILYYPGLKRATKRKNEEERAEFLAEHDIVITTYEVLRTELWVATDGPERSMRNSKQYERPKSPLMQLSWWRVCIDEAQMVENWTNNAAKLATMIPRVNAWGITGTPVKDDIQKDLRGLLHFLRFEPYASDTRIWNLMTTGNKEPFHNLFNMISMRQTKSMVRSEISIPAQRRYVITMPFTAVEEQNYQSLFKELAVSCGLDVEGNPLEAGWDANDPTVQSAMRTALDRLRQTALHPEVGIRNRRALRHRDAPMRTVEEVLDAMLEHSDGARRTDQRNLLSLMVTKGQVLAGLQRPKEALALWEEVREKCEPIVAECRQQLEHEVEEARKAASQAAQSSSGDDQGDGSQDTLFPRVGDARRRLRSALEVQHRAVFFCANGYFSIKSNEEMTVPGSEEFKRLEKMEVEGYDFAKAIRKEILQETYGKSKSLMGRLESDAEHQSFAVIPESTSADLRGIESRKIVNALEELCAGLNTQADQLDDWREHIIQLLLKPLVDEENDEITGEEYELSTKLQDEILVFVQVLRASLADRQAAITGQRNFLVMHETKVANRMALNGDGPFPEKLLELFKLRENIKTWKIEPDPVIPSDPFDSLKGLISELRALSVKLQHDATSGSSRAANELTIVTDLLKLTQKQQVEQGNAATSMEQETERFTETLNARLDFYRQLQAVSDMVGEYDGVIDEAGLETVTKQEDALQTKLATAESKHRYLVHLKETETGSEQRMCVICQSEFSIGVLTVCGHQFCKECITLWFKAHHNCPVCKRHLTPSNLHDITLKPQQLKVHSEGNQIDSSQPQTSPSKKISTIYSQFSPEKLAEIMNIELNGPNFTTKVDTLVRHLIWLRESDPGAKSIVFSQYKDFLDVLAQAFRRYNIGYTSFDKANGITNFKEDPGTEVFLLHARAHASGLNLVNASHVFLCEPLLNTALELQAIARVDRIGQLNETTVWLYIVDGTVEESIYNLSVQRRLEHMGRSLLKGKSKESTPELLDTNLDAANALEMQQARLSKLMGKDGISGEAVDKKDLLTCLFWHVRVRQDGEERMIGNPAIRGFLAAGAAEGRRERDAPESNEMAPLVVPG
ncbi:SNF2 family N-terminal domain-containing protein [Lasiosphaeris hirsuta]|uniref:SNF2 family N-terminal domain-containing protein n=1 Tax=Lasiosphaeris hirsuta TaxID=260670 RepID=A0AA40E183_9PEZI|nr:SNF2 family N-terminal domain-containing protein [Lasiosphaeris hirsuta]